MRLLAKSVLTLSLLLALAPLCAQGARDPTLPPPEVGLALNTDPKSPGAVPEASLSIVVRDKTLFIVQGTRLLAQGQKLGDARIERITETEVWLRQRGVLTKRPLFAGIVRRPSPPQGVSGAIQLSRSTP